jgi:hypothetical protein
MSRRKQDEFLSPSALTDDLKRSPCMTSGNNLTRWKGLVEVVTTKDVVGLEVVGKIDAKRDFLSADIDHRKDLVIQSHRITDCKLETRLTHDNLLAWVIGPGEIDVRLCPGGL